MRAVVGGSGRSDVLLAMNSRPASLACRVCRVIEGIYTSGHTSVVFVDDRQGVRRVRRGVEGTCPALGSGAVDAQFWALVCEDEEWLRAEFDAIVNAPAEAGRRPVRRPAIGAADHPGRRRFRPLEADNPTVVPPGQQGQSRRRERSPP